MTGHSRDKHNCMDRKRRTTETECVAVKLLTGKGSRRRRKKKGHKLQKNITMRLSDEMEWMHFETGQSNGGGGGSERD